MRPDLTTGYLGLTLRNPVVPSASPMTSDLDRLLVLEAAGASAVVLPSLFEEQIEHADMTMHMTLDTAGTSPEATDGFLPDLIDYNTGPADYLSLVHAARRELSIPVIASLNGSTPGGWTRYAELLEDAGVSALELNIYHVAADIDRSGVEIEQRYLSLVADVRAAVGIPLAVKVAPYFSSMGDMARRLVDAGADGLVLFNRFYQPDVDLETLDVMPALDLSSQWEQRLVIRWLAILYGRVQADLAATSGIHTAEGAIKAILAGADVAMMASALLRRGPSHLTVVTEGITHWLADNGYSSVDQARGSLARERVPDPDAYERSNYMKNLVHFSSDWVAGSR
jgi:dihydroorotate dehydrogenase (fumarate)